MSSQDLTLDGVNKPLKVKKIFKSIQGEGYYSGHPATFVRLSGCNLDNLLWCKTWCDTDYTGGSDYTIHSILSKCSTNLVIITGGEPFRQNISPLVLLLMSEGKQVQIETNGTLSNPDFNYFLGVVIACSPKTKRINTDMYKHATYFKYVIDDISTIDGIPITLQKPRDEAPVYLMPKDSNVLYTAKALKLCLENDYVLCLRLHQLLGLE